MPEEDKPFTLSSIEAMRVKEAVLAAASTGVFLHGGPEGLAKALITAFALIDRSTASSPSKEKAAS